jgi:hypothetical protein
MLTRNGRVLETGFAPGVNWVKASGRNQVNVIAGYQNALASMR